MDNICNIISDLNKTIEINPNDAEAYKSRRLAKYELQQNEEAILDFKKAIELAPCLKKYINLPK